MTFNITDTAATRISSINRENKLSQMLRIAVQGGGCSGFQYTFIMDDAQNPDDHVFVNAEATVIIDEVSLELLNGSTLDYQDDLSSSMFVIKNPSAKSGCGCGNSFSI